MRNGTSLLVIDSMVKALTDLILLLKHVIQVNSSLFRVKFRYFEMNGIEVA